MNNYLKKFPYNNIELQNALYNVTLYLKRDKIIYLYKIQSTK